MIALHIFAIKQFQFISPLEPYILPYVCCFSWSASLLGAVDVYVSAHVGAARQDLSCWRTRGRHPQGVHMYEAVIHVSNSCSLFSSPHKQQYKAGFSVRHHEQLEASWLGHSKI